MDTKRCRCKIQYSFAISFNIAPTTLANCPSFSSVISMLCMVVPKGISVLRG